MPERRAASMLPPTAMIVRPHFVRRMTKSMIAITTTNRTNISGTPRSWFSTKATIARPIAISTARPYTMLPGSVDSPAFPRVRLLLSPATRVSPATTTASTYATQGGRNVPLANWTRPEVNGRFTVPSLPRTSNCTPRKASRPASVMTKLGTPNRLNTTP
ncbi:hypothetical protein SDC9_155659 [bioreactor metagenome]|uniref:Uncharacterized protein n=1 Tax=bioreactor metagenome TaxID=1076179 RepID=A0A645F2D0_9ZZZZ